nr:G2/mitotic-specific cyclin-7 [Crypthecodinium cohnii]
MDLLPELLQTVMDWLPTFESRARLQFVNRTLRGLEWRWGAPLKLEEELSGLQLGDLGCEAVVAAAEAGTTLGELCLGDNGIGDRGAKALARMLANPTSTLRRLSLRNNCIGEEGAHILATALATNTMLEELDLWGNELSDRAKAELLTSGQCEVFLSLPRVLSPAVPIDEVNGRMRAILLDWISQLHTGVSSPVPGEAAPDPQDMLFRTFSHVDARLESQVVKREDLQLLGIACTLVAAGLGLGAEGGPEDLELASWLAFVTDGACTTEEVRAAAQSTRETLRFKLHQPTAYTFLRRYLRRTGWSEESFSLANYLIELATIDQGFLRFRPQAVAASAAVLSRQYSARNVPVRQMPRWRKKLLRCSNVDLEAELAPCLAAMSRLHVMQHGRSSMFVNKKYEWSRLHAVARIEPNEPQPARSWVLYMRSELLL